MENEEVRRKGKGSKPARRKTKTGRKKKMQCRVTQSDFPPFLPHSRLRSRRCCSQAGRRRRSWRSSWRSPSSTGAGRRRRCSSLGIQTSSACAHKVSRSADGTRQSASRAAKALDSDKQHHTCTSTQPNTLWYGTRSRQTPILAQRKAWQERRGKVESKKLGGPLTLCWKKQINHSFPGAHRLGSAQPIY